MSRLTLPVYSVFLSSLLNIFVLVHCLFILSFYLLCSTSLFWCIACLFCLSIFAQHLCFGALPVYSVFLSSLLNVFVLVHCLFILSFYLLCSLSLFWCIACFFCLSIFCVHRLCFGALPVYYVFLSSLLNVFVLVHSLFIMSFYLLCSPSLFWCIACLLCLSIFFAQRLCFGGGYSDG